MCPDRIHYTHIPLLAGWWGRDGRQEGVREEGRKEREKVEGRRSGESETQTQCTPYAGQRG